MLISILVNASWGNYSLILGKEMATDVEDTQFT